MNHCDQQIAAETCCDTVAPQRQLARLTQQRCRVANPKREVAGAQRCTAALCVLGQACPTVRQPTVKLRASRLFPLVLQEKPSVWLERSIQRVRGLREVGGRAWGSATAFASDHESARRCELCQSSVTRRKLQTPGNAEEHQKKQETPTINPIGPTDLTKPHRPRTKHYQKDSLGDA